MDRRGFFKLFGAGVAGIALEQAIPFGRVWSFPTKIQIATPELDAFQGLNQVIADWNKKAPLYIGVDPAYGRDLTVHWYTREEIERIFRAR